MTVKAIPTVAILTALLSVVSWTYRFIDEYMRVQELPFYILIPTVIWLLFAAPLFLLQSRRKYLRIAAMIVLVPTSLLWLLSVWVGFFGLEIH